MFVIMNLLKISCVILFCLILWTEGQSGYGDDTIITRPLHKNPKHQEICTVKFFSPECESRDEIVPAIGQPWLRKEDCNSCACISASALICCDLLKEPVDMPPNCEPFVNKEKCIVELRYIDQPDIKCVNKLPSGKKHSSLKYPRGVRRTR